MTVCIKTYRGGLALGLTALCCVIVAAANLPCEAAETIVLVGSEGTKDSFHGRWLALIYTETFRRLGYEMQYKGYPSARASKMSSAGKVDGEINRVGNYQDTHPNMIRVDESHFSTILCAYAVKPGIRLDGWQSLKNSDYRVEYRRGTKIVELGLKSVVRPENLSDISSAERGLKKLIRGRTDLYVDVRDLVTELLLKLDPARFDPSGVYVAGVLAEDSLHVYLHKKNAALVPKVEAVLKAMRREGLIERYKHMAMEQE